MLTSLLDVTAIANDNYTAFTFFIGTMAMMAASVFFFFELSNTDKKWRTSLLVSGLITFIEADTAAADGGSAALEVHLAGGAKLLIESRAQLALAAALIRELTNPRPC